MPPRASWLLAAAWLGLVLATLYGGLVASGHVLATGDGLAQDFPNRLLVAAQLAHGEWPFWNPFNFAGLPLLAGLQSAVFYPGNLPFLVLPPAAAMNAAVLGAYGLAGLGTLAYAAALGLGALPAAATATVWMAGGFMAFNLPHLPILQSAGMLPWMLWAIERHATSGNARYALAGGLFVALAILAGHPQMVAFGLALAAAYALYRTRRPRQLGVLALACLLGFGLAACQLWPAVDFVQASQRQAMSYLKLTTPSPDPLAAVLLLFPFLAGVHLPDALAPTPVWAAEWLIWLPAYVGAVGLALVAAALAGHRERPVVHFWAAAAVAALALGLGSRTPLYHLVALVPVFKVMPYPSRHFMELSLALAVLVGCGLEALPRLGGRARLAVWALPATGLALVCAALALRGAAFAAHTQPFVPSGVDLARALSLGSPALWLPVLELSLAAVPFVLARTHPTFARAGLLLLVALDLGCVSYHQASQRLCPVWDAPVPAMTLEPYAGRSLVIPAVPYPYYGPLAPLLSLPATGLSQLAGLRTVNGYDAFVYRRFGELTAMDSSGYPFNPAPWQPRHHAFELLGLQTVRIAGAAAATSPWRERLADPRWAPGPAGAEPRVFTRRRRLPRAWRPGAVLVLAAADVDRHVRGELPWEPLTSALLEEPATVPPGPAGAAEVKAEGFGRLRLQPGAPGLVVVSESYDPGWRATAADGRACAVHRADGLLLSVDVPAGAGEIALTYEPVHWRAGLALSLLSLLALLALGLRRPLEKNAA